MSTESSLPEPETPNLDAAVRKPTHGKTEVNELREERDALEAKFVEAKVETDLIRQALSLLDRLLDLAT